MCRSIRVLPELGILSLVTCLLLSGCCARVDRTWDDLPRVAKPRTDPTIARLLAETEADPNSGEVYIKLSEAYLQRGQVERGTEAALRALELEPENDQIMRLLLNLSLRSQKFGARVAQFCANLVNDKPGQSRALNILGVMLLRARQLDRAIHYFQQAIEADANFPHAAANLAVCYALQGDNAKADEWRTTATRLAPSDPTISLVLAGVYANRAQVDKALAEYDRVLSLAPDSPQIYLEIGRTHTMAGNFDQAEDAFRRALTIRPGFVPARMSLGKLLSSQRRYREALEQFKNVARSAPNMPDAHVGAGLLSYRLGDLKDAEQELLSALQLNPSSAEAANALAYLYADRPDKLDTALELAERATALSPSDPSIGDTYGWVLLKLGKTQQAIEKLTWAVGKAPDHPTIMYHLGVAYYQAGDKPRAIEWLRRALASTGRFASPTDRDEAQELLAEVSKE